MVGCRGSSGGFGNRRGHYNGVNERDADPARSDAIGAIAMDPSRWAGPTRTADTGASRHSSAYGRIEETQHGHQARTARSFKTSVDIPAADRAKVNAILNQHLAD